jgi:hypothetical protein
MKIIVGVAIIVLTLGGCASTKIEALPVEVTAAPVSFQNAQPIVTQPINWQVYTKENISDLINRMKVPGAGPVFVLSENGYKSFIYDLSELKRYISEQKAVLFYMKKTLDQRSRLPEKAK